MSLEENTRMNLGSRTGVVTEYYVVMARKQSGGEEKETRQAGRQLRHSNGAPSCGASSLVTYQSIVQEKHVSCHGPRQGSRHAAILAVGLEYVDLNHASGVVYSYVQ
jgi:hypothetical protein